jgi:hypothetical protein
MIKPSLISSSFCHITQYVFIHAGIEKLSSPKSEILSSKGNPKEVIIVFITPSVSCSKPVIFKASK